VKAVGPLPGRPANHDDEAVLRLTTSHYDDIRSLAQANHEAGGGTQEDKIRLGVDDRGNCTSMRGNRRGAAPAGAAAESEAVHTGPQSSSWLANLSFLVNRGSAARFLTAIDELRAKHPHVELRVNGPLPPYSFVGIPSSQQAEGGTAEAFGAAAAQPKG
jgi:hypothetical protein